MNRGLREAASWVSLRQHLFVALTHQRSLEVNLQLFRCSTVFSSELVTLNSQDWANRIIFLFAEILDFVLSASSHTGRMSLADGVTRWHEFHHALSDWYASKPWDLAPLWIGDSVQQHKVTLSDSSNLSPAKFPESSGGSGGSVSHRQYTFSDNTGWSPVLSEEFAQSRPSTSGEASSSCATARHDSLHSWPYLPTSSLSHLVALQYYHLCRITLATHSPHLGHPTIGPQHLRARKHADAIVIDGIRQIVGLSASDTDRNTVMFEASHTLKVFGGYIEDETMRRQAVEYLEWVEIARGWKTRKIVEELREQWTA